MEVEGKSIHPLRPAIGCTDHKTTDVFPLIHQTGLVPQFAHFET
jgi:hypothetical protein